MALQLPAGMSKGRGPGSRAVARVDEHYPKLRRGYLFPEIGRRAKILSDARPDAAVIRLGIGEVALPPPPAVVETLRADGTNSGAFHVRSSPKCQLPTG